MVNFTVTVQNYHIIHGHHENHLHKSVCSGQTLDLGLKTCHSGAATKIEIILVETTMCDHAGLLDLLLLHSGHDDDDDGGGGDDVVDQLLLLEVSVELLNVVLLVEDGRHAGGHALPLLCLGASHAVKILIDEMRQHRDALT